MNKTALELRIAWMSLMGFWESEIQESIASDPPSNVQSEQDDLDAAIELKNMDMSWLKNMPIKERPCTCHPDDNPPIPCAKQYALSECKEKSNDPNSPNDPNSSTYPS
jgi:hypothetical protein